MFNSIGEFFTCLVEARFGFEYIWTSLVGLWQAVLESPGIVSFWDWLMTVLAPALPFIAYIFIAIGAIICFFGQKIIGILKFVATFAAGFIIGVHFLAPLIPESIPIPPWVIGLVIAIVLAVFYKFIYFGVYGVAIIYSVYRLCMQSFYLEENPDPTVGRMIVSIVVAIVVLILACIFVKYAEMVMTAMLGSFIVFFAFSKGVFDLWSIPALGEKSWILAFVLILVLAVVGFIVQFKTRRRY